MQEEIIDIAGRKCHVVLSENKAEAVIIKPLGEFERLLLLDECRLVSSITKVSFTMVAFEVDEADLRPEFVHDTFDYLKNMILPYVHESLGISTIILGGYSLGGLFALWTACQLDDFAAVFAGSPSLWMTGWNEFADSHPLKTKYVFMSLGDKEECTRKQPFYIIGDRVRTQHQRHLAQLGEDNCMLEWNEGGHFKDIEQRKARGFAWCLNKLR